MPRRTAYSRQSIWEDDTRRDTETSTSCQLIRHSYVEKGECCTGATITAASLNCHLSFPVFLSVRRRARTLFLRQVYRLHRLAKRHLARMRLANLVQTLAIRDRTPRSREGHRGCLCSTNLSSKIRQSVTTAMHSLLWMVLVPEPWECSWLEIQSQSYTISCLFPCPCPARVEAQEENCLTTTSTFLPSPQGPQRLAALPCSHQVEHQASVPSSAFEVALWELPCTAHQSALQLRKVAAQGQQPRLGISWRNHSSSTSSTSQSNIVRVERLPAAAASLPRAAEEASSPWLARLS
jgi:hypothetical protein